MGAAIMHQSNPSVPIPPGHRGAFSCKARPGGWAFELKPLPGGEAFEIKDLEVLPITNNLIII
jgi:hypothetical protein